MHAPVYRNLDAPSTFLGLAFPMEWVGVLGAGWVGTALGAPNVGAAAAACLIKEIGVVNDATSRREMWPEQ